MKIVLLTGAGISAESGLGTFRDAGGVWSRYDLNEVATPEGFARDPRKVHAFYNARRAQAAEASPNAAHHAIARLQAEHAGDVVLVTQNVDALHEAAGATAIHMHGRLDTARCAACGHTWTAPLVLHVETPCPDCDAPAARPDVVWFGEIPRHMDDIAVHLAQADLFVAIGTSGQVYPAAGFVAEAAAHGAQTLELNLDSSDVSDTFDETRTGPATKVVPAWVDDLLARPTRHITGPGNTPG